MVLLKLILSLICGLGAVWWLADHLGTVPPNYWSASIGGAILTSMALLLWGFASVNGKVRTTNILPYAFWAFFIGVALVGAALLTNQFELPLNCKSREAALCIPVNIAYVLFGHIGAGLLVLFLASGSLLLALKWGKRLNVS